MSIISLDYGAKRIGVALAKEGVKVVLPWGVIENKSRDFVLDSLKDIIVAEGIKKIIVGWPVGLSGRVGPKARETEKFIDYLKENLDIPVEKFDERLSSRLAKTLSASRQNSPDVGAAMVILEGYLNL